jgi:hypothetical protein
LLTPTLDRPLAPLRAKKNPTSSALANVRKRNSARRQPREQPSALEQAGRQLGGARRRSTARLGSRRRRQAALGEFWKPRLPPVHVTARRRSSSTRPLTGSRRRRTRAPGASLRWLIQMLPSADQPRGIRYGSGSGTAVVFPSRTEITTAYGHVDGGPAAVRTLARALHLAAPEDRLSVPRGVRRSLASAHPWRQ